MSWVTPPSFSDGNILAASQLQQLADGITFLNGLGGLPNIAFPSWTSSTTGNKYYMLRHRHRYFHLQFSATGAGTMDYIKVYYNGVQILNDGNPPASNQYNIDLNSLGLTIGTWYQIEIQVAFHSGNGTIRFFWEDESAT